MSDPLTAINRRIPPLTFKCIPASLALLGDLCIHLVRAGHLTILENQQWYLKMKLEFLGLGVEKVVE